MFVKTGDKVKVIAGKDKGKEGTVLSVNAKTNGCAFGGPVIGKRIGVDRDE